MFSVKGFFSKFLVAILAFALIFIDIAITPSSAQAEEPEEPAAQSLSYLLSYPEGTFTVNVAVDAEGFEEDDPISLVKADQVIEINPYEEGATNFVIVPPTAGTDQYKLVSGTVESATFQVAAGVTGYQLTATVDNESFAANEATPQITWSTNTSLSELSSYYSLYIYEKPSGTIIYRSSNFTPLGATYEIPRFFDSGSKEYGLLVAKNVPASNYSELTEIQVETSKIISREPFVFDSESIDKSEFANSESTPVISAQLNQTLGYYGEPWNFYLVDVTNGLIAAKSWGSTGAVTFQIPTFDNDAARDYKVVVAKLDGNPGAAASTLVDVQIATETYTVSRKPWEVSLSITDEDVSSNEETPTITATANQPVKDTWSFYFVDEVTGKIRSETDGYQDGNTKTTIGIPRTMDDELDSYSVYVARKSNWSTNYVNATDLVDVQAISATVSTQSTPWEISIESSADSYVRGDPSVVVTANLNQPTKDLGWQSFLVNVDTGEILGANSLGNGDGTVATWNIPALYENETRTLRAYVGLQAGNNFTNLSEIQNIRAASNTVSINHEPWDAEIISFENELPNEPWPSMLFEPNQNLESQNYFCFYLVDASTGKVLANSWFDWTPNVKSVPIPRFWKSENIFLKGYLSLCSYGNLTQIQDYSKIFWESELIEAHRKSYSLTLENVASGNLIVKANQPVSEDLSIYLTNNNVIVAKSDYSSYWGAQPSATFPPQAASKAYLALAGANIGDSVLTLQDIQAVTDRVTILWVYGDPGSIREKKMATIAGLAELGNCTTACAGDPINTFTGEFYENNVDVSVPGIIDLSFKRDYSTWNKDASTAHLGKGWTHNFNRNIKTAEDDYTGPLKDSGSVLVTLSSGAEVKFVKTENGYATYGDIKGTLSYIAATDKFEVYNKMNRETLLFDGTSGKLVSITDFNGNSITLGYDSSGLLTEAVSSNGEALEFDYNSNDLISSVTDGIRTVSYTYDSSDRLTKVEHPLGLEQTYGYDSDNHIVSIGHLTGGSTTNDYDSEDRVIEQTDPLGRTLSFSYNGNNRVITDALDVQKLEKYSAEGRLLSVTDNYEGTTEKTRKYTYSKDGQISSITHEDGKSELSTYDNEGNLSRKVDAAGKATLFTYNSQGLPLTITLPNGGQQKFVYDANGNVTKSIDPLGNETTFAYNSKGLQTKITDALAGETNYTYTSQELVETITKPNGAVTEFSYSAGGDVTSITDGEGNTSTTTLDSEGKTLVSEDAEGNETTYAYDSKQRLSSVTQPNGTVEEYTYDLVGNLTKVVAADDSEAKYRYDELNRVVELELPNGAVTTFVYDAFGQKTSEIDALENETTFTYTPRGDIKKVTSPEGAVTEYFYDAVGNLIREKNPNGEETKYTYDSTGGMLSREDANGNITHFEYDLAKRLTKQINADSTFETFAYDALGRTTGYVDAANKAATYGYNSVGNRTSSSESGVAKNYEYDLNGRLVKEIDLSDNSFKEFEYDGVGNPISEAYSDASIERSFEYDSMNRRTSVSEGSDQTNYAYDLLGRLVGKETAQGDIGYSYDELGNLTELEYPSGAIVEYSYDLLNRMSTVERNSYVIASYSYDADGKQTSATANNDETTYGYDAVGRLTSKNSEHIAQTYEYDQVGNAVASTIEFSLPGGGSETRENDYEFDSRYRMASLANAITADAATTSSTGDYTFDNSNNVLEDKAGGVHTLNPNSQLSKIVNGDTETDFTYSARGNLVGETQEVSGVESSSVTYGYDIANRLVESNVASNPPNSGSKDYGYSSEGLLDEVSTTIGTANSVEESYLWDTTSAVPSLLEKKTGSATTEYVYGNANTPIAEVKGTVVKYYATDRQGSLIGVVSSAGALEKASTYSEYGVEEPVLGNMITQAHGYTGAIEDDFTGNYYLVNRFYDPNTTRFLSVDPLLTSTHSAYSYVTGNPLNYSDPLGLEAIPTWNDVVEGFTSAENQYNVGQSLMGLGNGWSFGVSGFIMDTVSPGSFDHCNEYFNTSTMIGEISTAIIPGGAAFKGTKSLVSSGKLPKLWDAVKARIAQRDEVGEIDIPGLFAKLNKGKQEVIRTVDSEKPLMKIWDDILKDSTPGTNRSSDKYSIIERVLDNGKTASLRSGSGHGGKTIDFNIPGEKDLWKIHIQ